MQHPTTLQQASVTESSTRARTDRSRLRRIHRRSQATDLTFTMAAVLRWITDSHARELCNDASDRYIAGLQAHYVTEGRHARLGKPATPFLKHSAQGPVIPRLPAFPRFPQQHTTRYGINKFDINHLLTKTGLSKLMLPYVAAAAEPGMTRRFISEMREVKCTGSGLNEPASRGSTYANCCAETACGDWR